MGLDISHDTWHGSYSAFMTWRRKIAEVAGLPPLDLMEGFYDPLPPNEQSLPTLYRGLSQEKDYPYTLTSLDERLPIKWDCLKPMYLFELLYHSDCGGHIAWSKCRRIADDLEKLLPALSELPDQGGHIGNWKEKTEIFIKGLRLAYSKKERLVFR